MGFQRAKPFGAGLGRVAPAAGGRGGRPSRSEEERQLARPALVEIPGQRHGIAGEAAHGVAASALALVPSGIKQGDHRVGSAGVLGPLGRSFHGEGLATAATVASVWRCSVFVRQHLC